MIHPGHQVSIQAPRLSEVLFDRSTRNFATIATIPSNVRAHDAALLFATGTVPLVALIGPSGWGKSHLLEAVATAMAHDASMPHEVHSAVEWINSGSQIDAPGPLLLDNVQDALDRPRLKLQLRIALERRVRGGKRAILSFTASKATRQIKNLLPYTRDWLIASVASPDAAERMYVLQQMCVAEGLHLSPTLSRLIATRMKGNGRTIAGALKRLRLSGTTWLDSRATLRGCGALEPYFADDSGWDLGEWILRGIERSVTPSQFSRMDAQIYVMIREAGLAEAQVAARFRIGPAEVYQRVGSFHEALVNSPDLRRELDRSLDLIVSELLTD